MNTEIITSPSSTNSVSSFSTSLSFRTSQQDRNACRKALNLKQVPDRDADGYRIIRQTHSLFADKIAKYESAAHLADLVTTWMVIADDKQAQIYECKKIFCPITEGVSNEQFEPYITLGREWNLVANGIMTAELHEVSHGNTVSRTETCSQNILASVSLHNNAYFVQTIIERLHLSYSKMLFDRLVLVSSPDMIVKLEQGLNRGVQDSIIGIMSRNSAGI